MVIYSLNHKNDKIAFNIVHVLVCSDATVSLKLNYNFIHIFVIFTLLNISVILNQNLICYKICKSFLSKVLSKYKNL